MRPYLPWIGFFVLVSIGCSAAAVDSGNGATKTNGNDSPDGGAASGDPSSVAKTCDESVDFDTDAANCGRCGRVCDDGACHQGMCTPRVEVTFESSVDPGDNPGLACVDDFEIVGGTVFVASTLKGLGRVRNRAFEPMRSDFRCVLATDGKELIAVARATPSGVANGSSIERFSSAGASVGKVSSAGIEDFPVWTATDGKVVATMGLHGGSSIDLATGAVRNFGIDAQGRHKLQFVGADLYARIDYQSVVRIEPAGGTTPVATLDDMWADWAIVQDRIYKMEMRDGVLALVASDLETKKTTVVAELDDASVKALAPTDWILEPRHEPSEFNFGVVTDGAKVYLLVPIIGLHPPATSDDGREATVIAEVGEDGKLRRIGAASPAAEYTYTEPVHYKIRDGRLYWRSGSCRAGGGSILSIPL
jgi:hypothetical protein